MNSDNGSILNTLGTKQDSRHGSNRLPENVYTSVVRSLYADSKTLVVGIVSMVAAPMVLYWKTNDLFHVEFACLFLVFGLARLLLASLFERSIQQPISVSQYAVWENRYVWVSSAYVLLLGIWAFVSMARSDDPFVRLMVTSLTLCYLIGIIGRNFGSDKVVKSQVAIGCLLLTGGMVAFGGLYDWILAGFMVPFFIAIRLMAGRLRNILHQSEVTAEENRIIANRFDVALENIEHGVAMFDRTGKIVVANDRFSKLVGLGDKNLVSDDVSTLNAAHIGEEPDTTLAEKIRRCLPSDETTQFSFRISSGETIEAHYYSMPLGGFLLLSDISERVAADEAIKRLASSDSLTELHNRRFFLQEAALLMNVGGEPKPCSMYFVDLDKFKAVNDTLGHGVGDHLLKTIASRIQLQLPDNALSCRFGGDEFIILLPEVVSRTKCAAFARKIINEINRPVLIDNNQLNVGASIGIAVVPDDGANPEELLRHTDAALYDAKGSGRSTYAFYSDALGEKMRVRRALELDLRSALCENKLEVHYQPLINLARGRIGTCEALVRWEHPEHGRISPDVFVRLAEETGLIIQLGEYVLKKAATDCLTWPDGVRVAVNVSSIQFQQSDLCEVISRILLETGLTPERLEIEVTETAMLQNLEETTAVLRQLAQMGVRVSLDDFGTGFSSLSYLHSLPLDKVKIDKSFIENGIADNRTRTLLSGVVNLTKALGLSVVLEGIETREQVQVLMQIADIDEMQGYLFARPMPPNDMLTLLQCVATNTGFRTEDSKKFG